MALRTCAWFRNISGPGVMPWIMKAPMMSAAAIPPGMPSANNGMSPAGTTALSAASAAATPSSAPWPKRSGVDDVLRTQL